MLSLLSIPEDPQQLPSWLEEQLTGVELGVLVTELSAVHDVDRPGEEAATLDELLGDNFERVLTEGVSALDAAQVRGLLKHPALLLDLQALVLVEGGPHWQQQIDRSPDDQQFLQSIWQLVEQAILPPPSPAQRGPVNWWRRPWFVSACTAAAVLLAVWGVQYLRQSELGSKPTAWGWNRVDALPQEVSGEQYLNHLAVGAGQWFDKRPDTRQALARRILQFRQGCSQLLIAEHQPLSNEDRQWLRERCRAWAGKFDDHLAAAESAESQAAVLQVREKMDATVRKLVAALQSRAKGVS